MILILIIVFIIVIFFEITTKKKLTDGQVSQEPLTTKQKVLTWILCIFNPIIAGAVLYYGWKKQLPIKAKQANSISLWAFLLEIIIGLILSSIM